MGNRAGKARYPIRKTGPVMQSEDDYLGSLGLRAPMSDYLDDKWRVPHGMTASQEKKYIQDAQKAAQEYQEKRQQAKQRYQELVSQGKIVPPTRLHELVRTAAGHPDNASVQAARRSLLKRYGITYTAALAKKMGIPTFS